MDLSNTTIADRLAARQAQNNTTTTTTSNSDNTMFNSTTSNNSAAMSNIKSVEIVLNIAMTSGIIPATSMQVWQAENKSSIINARSLGRVNYNSQDDSVYASFVPLCERDIDAYGKNNRAVVLFHLEDGSTKTLNKSETVKFWNSVLNVENAEEIKFSVKANPSKAAYNRTMVQEGIATGRIRSLRIVWEGSEDLFAYQTNEEYGITLFPNEAAVNFHSKTVDAASTSLGFRLQEDFFVTEGTSNAPDFSRFSKETVSTSTKRREFRKTAQVSAARSGADSARKTAKTTHPTTPQVEETVQAEIPVTAPAVVAEPITVTAPVVDTEKEALRAENAEQKVQIANLTNIVAEQSAKIDQLSNAMTEQAAMMAEQAAMMAEMKAMMAAQQQAAPTPVVEAPVVEEPTVAAEETTEETTEEVAEAPKEIKPLRGRARATTTNPTTFTVGEEEIVMPLNIFDED